jgi:ATP-binding cassette, subfamily C (CFTR/MRP), member 1
MTLADKLIALNNGKIVETGRPELLLTNGGYIATLGLELTNADEAEPDMKFDASRVNSVAAELRLSTHLSTHMSTHLSARLSAYLADDPSGTAADEPSEAAADTRRKSGNLAVYKYYFACSGYFVVFCFALGIAIWTFLTEFPSKTSWFTLSCCKKLIECVLAVWLDWWSAANAAEPNKNIGMYMGVYAFFGIFALVVISVSAW